MLNIYGFINFSRDVPDGKDVNRSFPGNMQGSLASRVARVVTKQVLPKVDFGIDFHTGGASRYNYPQVRYSRNDDLAKELAFNFAPPFIIEKSVIRKSLRKEARDMGVPIIVYEGGEALRFDGFSISKGVEGIRRLLHKYEMLEATQPVMHPVYHIKKTTWIRATISGMFTWFKSSGSYIRKGERIGEIGDPYGIRVVRVYAKRDGYIIGHNNAPVINQGDALFHIGYDVENVDT